MLHGCKMLKVNLTEVDNVQSTVTTYATNLNRMADQIIAIKQKMPSMMKSESSYSAVDATLAKLINILTKDSAAMRTMGNTLGTIKKTYKNTEDHIVAYVSGGKANKNTDTKQNKNTTTDTGKGTGQDKIKAEEKTNQKDKTKTKTYTVVKGDCLWNIAKKYYGDGSKYTLIYNANKKLIGNNPNLIYAGQSLVIPGIANKLADKAKSKNINKDMEKDGKKGTNTTVHKKTEKDNKNKKSNTNSNTKPNSNTNKDKTTKGTTGVGAKAAKLAQQYVGKLEYVYGGQSLKTGADCSGFVKQIYKKFGIELPRTSREQATFGKTVSSSNMQPGDLVFYKTGNTVSHVAMYIGNGKVVHASNTRTDIKISNVNYRTPGIIKRVV